MSALTREEAERRLPSLPGWAIENDELVKFFAFKDFSASLSFVNRVGEAAERAGHHPDIDIRYSRVRLALTTHDAGGLSEKDFALAADVEKLV